MPADDLVLNVRQIAGYPPTSSASPSAALLMQIAGLGSAYASINPQALVGTALATGGDMAIAGSLAVQAVSGGSAQFSNGMFGMLSAQKACIVDFAATYATVGGVQIATMNDLAAQYAASVNSFNGRVGNVSLWIDDIICAGGAPIYAPRFQGDPRACTPPPTSNSSRLATTAFVATAVGGITGEFAPIDSPNFTGVPTAPTPALGSSDGQLATTAFVQNAVAESTTGVASFNARTGAVVLIAADLTAAGGALLASPVFTGVPLGPTAAPGTNTTQLATTQFVMAAVTGVVSGVSSFNARTGAVTLNSTDITGAGGALVASSVASFNGRTGAVNLLANDISGASGALLASPAFTGTPTAPTPPPGDSSTRLATTAFVAGMTGFAPIASPAFTGVPTAPTAIVGTNTTQLATTAFVVSEIAGSTAGVASFNSRTGVVTLLANDITAAGGALLASPALTGTPSAPTAAVSTSTTQLATTAFVMAAIAGKANLSGAIFTGLVSAPGVNAGAQGMSSQVGLTFQPASGLGGRQIIGAQATTNTPRWAMVFGDTTAESGSNAGSNFTLTAYSDAGAPLGVNGAAIQINRPNQAVVFGGGYVGVLPGSASASPTFNCLNSAGAVNCQFYFDAPNAFAIVSYSSTWHRLNSDGSFQIFSPTATKPSGGAWTAPSDDRIKTVRGDYDQGLDEVLQLRPVRFVYNGNDTQGEDVNARITSTGPAAPRAASAPYPNSPHYELALAGDEFVGFVAQEVETVLPRMVTRRPGFIDGKPVADLRDVDVSDLTYALVNAVKTLAARLETLEARMAT
jgi:hypothetical protein